MKAKAAVEWRLLEVLGPVGGEAPAMPRATGDAASGV
jgi:hypothetical protein